VATDDYASVARIVEQSRIAAACRAVVRALEMGAERASVARLARGCAARWRARSAAARVRLCGVALLAASATQATVASRMPLVVRPIVPAVAYVEVVLFALVFIAAAEPIGRAWPTSRLGRFFSADPSPRARRTSR
jgi:hypothetical protein